jgi:hypothetical protein
MEFNKTLMGTSAQLANGTPSDRVILKSFFKDDKVPSPTKDINGRYWDNMNIPEIKKLEMGYVPSVESRLKLYDGIEIGPINTCKTGRMAALC